MSWGSMGFISYGKIFCAGIELSERSKRARVAFMTVNPARLMYDSVCSLNKKIWGFLLVEKMY